MYQCRRKSSLGAPEDSDFLGEVFLFELFILLRKPGLTQFICVWSLKLNIVFLPKKKYVKQLAFLKIESTVLKTFKKLKIKEMKVESSKFEKHS